MLRKILIGVLVILLLSQFIRPPHNDGSESSPTDITHMVSVPENVMGVLKKSCYDCHSNHTEYPWYSKITPVNWWLNNHIQDGKRKLNFSDFKKGSYKRMIKKLDEVGETVEKHEMPLDSYLWIHHDARLSEEQQKILINWSKEGQQQVLEDSLKNTKS